MDPTLCKLTLVVPRRVQQSVLDVLDRHDPPLTGYTLLPGEGRSSGLVPATGAEKVRGAVEIAMILLVLPEQRVPAILDAIRLCCAAPHIAFWTEPVRDYGVLA